VIVNNGTEPLIISSKDKIAQLIIEKLELVKPELVQTLQQTVCDTKGFGSTDNNLNLIRDPLALKMLKLNKTITIKLPGQKHYSKDRIKYKTDCYVFNPIENSKR